MNQIGYSAASAEILREIIRQAEIKLQAQLQAALAADSRALGVAAAMATIAALLMGGAAAVFQSATAPAALAWIGVWVAGILLFAGTLAVVSARAIGFDFPGSEPSAWEDDIGNASTLKQSLGDMADHYDTMIADNARRMKRAGWIFNASLIAAGLDLAGGIVCVVRLLAPASGG
ncbi:hypothetical protein [Minwuia thermotolerans]|uniref:Uncharacterized protein n=1 Tax=Minwuia thermotolerans TaxID=2056226 RepID=A0A2M9G2K4_9PROT|nr:hypothetical protein [Minwuia thermotolerans]PJK29957.1 hypothetical protein CVT23_09320 [Minwuia thermotolerans]